MANLRDPSVILRIARMRYEEKRSQQDIAAMLGISSSTVSRALKQARDLGFVEIRVVPPSDRLPDLEHALEEKFGVPSAVVVHTAEDGAQTRHRLGRAVAEFLAPVLRADTVIGVSDGRTTATVVQHMSRTSLPGLEVVPLIGGVGMVDAPTHPHEVARELAMRIGARTWQLPAPAMVDCHETAATLVDAPIVRAAFEVIRRCSVALVGVGAISPEAAIVRHGVVTVDEIAGVGALGAVGSICARFYDGEGNAVPSELDARTLAITLPQLKSIPFRIAVANGEAKVPALRAGLRGRIVNSLGTDEATAHALLSRNVL